ncbi:hypothetical protein CEP51_005179 [Fusarium floridanum]|uniref:FAD dependent oxidoreductase domain-containing protein n=1 Tax=Fusarium floridanum TaxID=1325733 RepID=A0A428RY16_9HYPO|nr:hypothetical protein CEP51_005179 [Fusarium floridanum]
MLRQKHYVVIGAGVIGLTTALELKRREGLAQVTILAKEVPGDTDPTYCSAWAGANWVSCATDNGPHEDWDRVTYLELEKLSCSRPEAGVRKMTLRSVYDEDINTVGILSKGTDKIWYEALADLDYLKPDELPEGAKFGYDISTFIIDTPRYLLWLEDELKQLGVKIQQTVVDNVSDISETIPEVSAVFNCTGLGAFSLGGVQDKAVYPSKGQILVVEAPPGGINRMTFRSDHRLGTYNTHVFPRGEDAAILGGCKFNDDWSGAFDLEAGEEIKRRCCALVPELGKPEDLKVLAQGVGLRPCRRGGPRVGMEEKDGLTIIHNYGAAGAGYQASWGMAKAAADLLGRATKL